MYGKEKPSSREQAGQWGPKRKSALPGRGGLARIGAAMQNSIRGLFDGFMTEAAIKQEIVIAAIAFPISFFITRNIWIWLALVASLLFVLSVEFMNTALERLCDHVQLQRHNAIRVTKDLASAAVFFALVLAGLVWLAAIVDRLGFLG
jgi:diacylglycerol kinase (ATP)